MSEPKRLPARFYRSDAGREPVREWLKNLDVEDRKVIGEDIKDVEFSWPIGLPLVRSLGKELWEVRSSLPRGRIARVISASQRIMLSCSTVLSRRPRKLRNPKLPWRSGANGRAHEKEKYRFVIRQLAARGRYL